MPRVSTKKLNRLISFRISENDYQVLLDSRKKMNAESVSEAARELIRMFVKTGGDFRKLGLARSLRKIEGDMTELRGELCRLQND